MLSGLSESVILVLIFQERGTGALVVVAMLDFLNFALSAPYSETTDEKHFDTLLEMVADRGKTIFRLFQVFNKCQLLQLLRAVHTSLYLVLSVCNS